MTFTLPVNVNHLRRYYSLKLLLLICVNNSEKFYERLKLLFFKYACMDLREAFSCFVIHDNGLFLEQ